MAKRKPTATLVEMETILGFKVDSLNYPNESVQRLYSDLVPVSHCAYEKTKKEFEESGKKKHCKDHGNVLKSFLPELGVPYVTPPPKR
jgi:hypothetical protein